MTEEQTFDKLRRTPLSELVPIINGVKYNNVPSPLLTIGERVIDIRGYYDKTIFFLEIIETLKQHGWTVEEYHRELEKEAIVKMVNDFNASLNFPEEIINRAKTFFPNIKFTKASIELE